MPKTITIHREKAVGAAIDKCVHFGFCTAVCPTYVLDAEENDSPRGRIALAKEMLAAGGKPKAETILHLDRCLSCLSCETTCAANVPYREIIDGAREYIEASGARPWTQRVFRTVLAKTLTTPGLLSMANSLARLMPKSMANMPGPVGALAALSRAPAVAALRTREDGELSGAARQGPADGKAHGAMARAGAPAADETGTNPPKTARRVGLLNGCVQSVLGGEINAAALRLLARAGISVIELDKGQCCGALELHMGKRSAGARKSAGLVREVSRMLAVGEIEAVVTTTSGCNSVIQHFDEVLADNPELRAEAERVKAATHDICIFALELDLPATGAANGARVSYHDACSMTHGLKLTRQPRQLFKQLSFDQRNIAEAHLCCGSAGVYNILQPEISARLGKRKADNASIGDPDVIAAGNLGCLVQISRFTPVPVAHTVQLLDWATGGPPPRGLEGFQPRALPEPEPAFEAAAPAQESEEAFW